MKVPEFSERDNLMAKLLTQGIALFGSQEKFYNWLNAKNAVMGGETPADYLETLSGINLDLYELNAIEHGFSA